MNSEDGQVFFCKLQFSCFTEYNRMQSKHKQTKCERSRRNSQITAFSVDFTILNQRIIWKDYFEFVTEFPCLLGHPVYHSYFKVRPFDVTEFITEISRVNNNKIHLVSKMWSAFLCFQYYCR